MANPLAHEKMILAQRDREMIPMGLIYACVALALSALAIVSYAQLSGTPNVGVPDTAPIVAEKMIRLEGSRSGDVVVTDMENGRTAQFASNESGFISVITRGLDRKRLVNNIDGNPPVRLVEYENGRLAIQDPASGWSAELAFFGDMNREAFAQLLR